MKEKVAALFKTKTRDEWCKIMEGSDVCFAPVLSMAEAPKHPHNQHRGTFVEVDGVVQPGPAPRFSRTPSKIQRPPAQAGRAYRGGVARMGLQPRRARQAPQLRRHRRPQQIGHPIRSR